MFGSRFFLRNASNYIPHCRLARKIAIVTGSTEGIGYAIARRLGLEGALVCICSRKLKKVCEAIQKLCCDGVCVTGIVCDVTKIKDRENLIHEAYCKFGGIDILICNAGTNFSLGSIMKCDEKMWDKIFDTNLKSSFLLAKGALPFMKKRGGGSIVLVSSIAGLRPLTDLGLYSITKTAVLGLTKAMAHDLAEDKITVNAVAPGIIKTKFSKELWSGKKYAEHYIQHIPLNKFGEANDIAATVAFLVSDDGKYITGETVVTAGGMASHL